MQDFFEILIYIIVGFWIFSLLLRWAFPHLIKFFIGRMAKKAKNSFNNDNSQPFGNTSDRKNKNNRQIKNNKEKVGEYIDFEEID